MGLLVTALTYGLPVLVAFILYPLVFEDPTLSLPGLSAIYPYLLLWTPYREENRQAWLTHVPLDARIQRPPRPVHEIRAEDYSFDAIRVASRNFRLPVVVRGLFKNSTAVREWKTEKRLIEFLGGFSIPVVRNAVVGTLQDHREIVRFDEAFREMLALTNSKEYLFFPVKSRFTFNGSEAGSAERLQAKVDEVCDTDLNLDLIWPGFGKKGHKTFAGSQFVIGKSTPDFSNQTTGSDWHCAIGNNWFILAAGRKRWDFVEPKYSHFMSPLKGGMYNMWTGNSQRTASITKHIPTWTTVMEEGDMIYNPDWMWHRVTNFGGLSIGVPIREKNLTLSMRNNPYFTSIVFMNTFLARFNASLGGFPPPSAATEQDN
jgi:hypothetical protein